MDDAINSSTKKTSRQDRVTLKGEATVRLAQWREELLSHYPGMKISNAELVHYCIFCMPERLTPTDLKKIKNQFFDEVEFAAWALSRLREARMRGEILSLFDVIAPPIPAVKTERRPKKSREVDKTATGIEVPAQ